MTSPAEILRTVLIDAGVGVLAPAAPWPIFVSSLATSDTPAICVYDTAPVENGRAAQTKIRHPGWQVRIQARDYPTAWAKMSEVIAAFDAVRYTTVTTSGHAFTVWSVSTTSGPMAIGHGTAKRLDSITLNGTCTIRE